MMAKETNGKAKEETFESKLARLEETVGLLERDDVPLEEAIELYEKGIALHRECEKILASAKLRIEKLSSPDENKEA